MKRERRERDGRRERERERVREKERERERPSEKESERFEYGYRETDLYPNGEGYAGKTRESSASKKLRLVRSIES